MLIIGRPLVYELLPMDECMAVMGDALRALAGGGCVNPLRPILSVPGQRGVMGMMPAYLDSPEALGVKIITVFHSNEGTAYDSHQGVVLLFEADHGVPVAMVDAAAITAIRTAAVSGVATQALARTDAHDLALLGSGVQARTHLEAMLVARPIQRIRIWSRSAGNAQAFARKASRDLGREVEIMPSARDAVEGADIICTVTSSRQPVLRGDWLAPGAHVNAVGSSVASARELDTIAVVRSRLFVDRRESVLREAGDFLLAREEKAVGDDHIIAELGEVLSGAHAGRRSAGEITLFKSLGLGIEDVAAAQRVHRNALARGLGVSVALGEEAPATPAPKH